MSTRRAKPHAFNYLFIKWPVCTKCGLVYLNNRESTKDAKKPCPGSEQPDKEET